MITAVKKHKFGLFNLAAYSALIIYGANLLIDHGELKADVKHYEQALTDLTERCYRD